MKQIKSHIKKASLKILILFFFETLLFPSCKEVYEPQVVESQNSYLVIEGALNNGGPTTIKLSRTQPLNELQGREKPELKAIVSIESETNQKYLFTEQVKGEYTIELNLNNTQKYRLRIKTANDKEYLSDFVLVKRTPPIDKVSWKKEADGMHIYVDTHDPQNNARYYRWGNEETWIANVQRVSKFEYVNGVIQPRVIPAHRVCYDTDKIDPLSLGSTAKLSDDVVHEALVYILPLYSRKLSEKYSILVKQYALEQKAYEYWQAMKKNTEQLGSIFDPQPSYMYSNIYSVSNPKELVIGYFGACNVTEKRIFITALEADWVAPPPGWHAPPP